MYLYRLLISYRIQEINSLEHSVFSMKRVADSLEIKNKAIEMKIKGYSIKEIRGIKYSKQVTSEKLVEMVQKW